MSAAERARGRTAASSEPSHHRPWSAVCSSPRSRSGSRRAGRAAARARRAAGDRPPARSTVALPRGTSPSRSTRSSTARAASTPSARRSCCSQPSSPSSLLTRRREPRTRRGRRGGGRRARGARNRPAALGRGPLGAARPATGRERREDERRRASAGDAGPRARSGSPGPEHAQAMTVVVRTAARTAAPVLAVAGVYLAAWGYSPGGGFPGRGGASSASSSCSMRASAASASSTSFADARRDCVELAGAAAIVAIAVLGLILKGAVSANFLPLATSPRRSSAAASCRRSPAAS